MSSASGVSRNVISLISGSGVSEEFKVLNWEGSFEQYLDIVASNPKAARNAFQRIYDMIIAAGVERYLDGKDEVTRYLFFTDPIVAGNDVVFGLDRGLEVLVRAFSSAARNYGLEKRVLLLHGPVGSAKSTIVHRLKRGAEAYSRTDTGALYTLGWVKEGGGLDLCPMHEEPLRLIPPGQRPQALAKLNEGLPELDKITIAGDLCPYCRWHYNSLMRQYDGDWVQVASNHVRVRRITLSEKDRVGIGTFQPKDEKNQDSTELTGDINYRKIALYGSDSDPRAFNFDGEFNIANRGLVEFIEVLKLDVAFLYDLLGASQEHSIKPKKFPQVDIDEVIIGHTNEPEFRRLQSDQYMEALRDRTAKIDVPYVTRLGDEIKIYEKDYNPDRVKGKHIAPHTIEMAGMWAVLTRLAQPKESKLNLLQKLRLYNGATLPGFTEDNIRELRAEAPREGMEGISPRYIQDKISNALVDDQGQGCVNPFMVLNELEAGLGAHSLITSDEQRRHYERLLAVVRQEYEEVVKNEVQRAIAADEEALTRLCASYIDNVRAYTQKEKVRNQYTGQNEEPDERLMRSIESLIDIPENGSAKFRSDIMSHIGVLAIDRKVFGYKSNERLQKAFELKLFADQKDSVKLSSLVSGAPLDKDTQEKIDVVKARLVSGYGYCPVCAFDVLKYAASVFAREEMERGRSGATRGR